MRHSGIWGLAVVVGLAAAALPRSASACGGFFCSQAAGVNQAAERIVFANNGDGTVTAVIEIQYQGPSDKFSWLLPISSVPMGKDIQVASSQAFGRLQTATNPRYSLTTRVEGTCDVEPTLDLAGSVESGGAAAGGGPSTESGPGGVTVDASGVVGAFEWTVISLDAMQPQPADAAVAWLNTNGYDVPDGAPGLLGPYLSGGMHLLALRLKKGATTGSIRPIVLTYAADKPMIPIKLTAVAANDNMGVMTWLLGAAQAVPVNYNALELNEARINWFNPSANYNDVVNQAADEASGQGFVTEYAQGTDQLKNVTWSDGDEQAWSTIQSGTPAQTPADLAMATLRAYANFDGFWDVFGAQVTLPTGTTLDQVKACPFCNYSGLVPSAGYLAAIEAEVIVPARVIQKLIDGHPQITRLYSTLSPAEMTVDPLFSYNPDLEPVSNVHTAERVIECAPGYYFSTAPWRIELPQGGVVRGGPDTLGSWPAAFDAQPANRRILRRSEVGAGKVLEDNGAKIDRAVTTYSESVPTPPMNGGAGGSSGVGGGTSGVGGSRSGGAGRTNSAQPGDEELTPAGGGCGCHLASQNGYGGALTLLGLGLFGVRRRRR
jgi:MYXO-CTERM domain-containing protein